MKPFHMALVALLLLLAGVATWFYFFKTKPLEVELGKGIIDPTHITDVPTNTPPRAGAQTNEVAAKTNPNTQIEQTPEEKEREKILAVYQDALDDDDEARILAEALKLVKHPDPEVRREIVFGLRWIGPKGVVALTDMLHDPDPEVTKDAAEAWLNEIADMEDKQMKAELLGMAAQNPDALDDDTFSELVFNFLDIPAHLAVPRLFDMFQKTQNPERKEEILDPINVHVEPDELFDMDDLPRFFKEMPEWLAKPENQKEKPEDDE